MERPSARPPHEVGEGVLYRTCGICRICDIAPLEFGNDKTDYYVPRSVYDESSVAYAPVDSELVEQMRPVLNQKRSAPRHRQRPARAQAGSRTASCVHKHLISLSKAAIVPIFCGLSLRSPIIVPSACHKTQKALLFRREAALPPRCA